MVDCPKGTFSSARGLTIEDECIDCPNGFICPNLGMVEADFDDAANQCSAGQYCGASIDNVSVTPQTCDIGRKCPANSME